MLPRRIVLSFLATALVALVSVQAAAAPRAYLRSSVIVEADSIRLGDVFDGAGKNADKIIAYAPPAGRKLVLEAVWLRRVARAYRVEWRPSSRLDRSVVERRSQIISTGRIVDTVLASIRARNPEAGELEIELDNQSRRIFLPHDMPPTLTVRAVSFDPRSRRFSIQIVAPDDRPGAIRTVVAGQAHALVRMPVLTRRMRRNDIIRERDIAWKPVRAKYVSSGAIRDAEDLIGFSPRRPIAANRAIRIGDVQAPVLVVRGKRVTILLKTATMQLNASGKALESGAMGDVVRVKNTNSGNVIEAVVIGDKKVAVTINNNLALR
jgi:flagella basal body P-ring formation protein FlgA